MLIPAYFWGIEMHWWHTLLFYWHRWNDLI
jgi:hypothetical protein